jgi:hypothetical protein
VRGGSNVGFVAIVYVGVYFCCSVGCLCWRLQGLGLCKVGTVGLTAGSDCVGGSSSVVTGWGVIGVIMAGGESG